MSDSSNESPDQLNISAVNGNDVQRHKKRTKRVSQQTLNPPPPGREECLGFFLAGGGLKLSSWRRRRQKVDNQDQTPLCADERWKHGGRRLVRKSQSV